MDAEHVGWLLDVDLGVNNLAVTSTGTFWTGDEFDQWRREYETRRGDLQECGTRWAHENSQESDSTEDHRYADICGATNRSGIPCKLPAGWGTPGSGGTRCKFHGGLSSGPDDISHLEGNEFVKDSPSGCPPENNDNAVIHAGFSDWRTVYERFRKDPLTRQRIETLVSAYLHTAQEHATDVDLDRWKELANASTIQFQSPLSRPVYCSRSAATTYVG